MSKLTDKLKSLVSKVAPFAPVIATAIGGPGAGLALRTLSKVLTGRDDSSKEQMEAALAEANPEILLKLKEADNSFELEQQRIAAEDRASARRMRIETGDWIPGGLAVFITLGFFGVLGYLLKYGLPHEGGDAMLVMLGALGTAWGAVVNFYFGSSASSL